MSKNYLLAGMLACGLMLGSAAAQNPVEKAGDMV
jgi:hypothetical protein